MDITHCPNCHTAFKVREEQLRAANGWVRCGKCQNVFEAHLHFAHKTDMNPSASFSGKGDSIEGVRPGLFASDAPTQTQMQSGASWFWSSLSVLLTLVLLWQAVLWNRNRLVAEEPALRRAVEALCMPIACKVDWPQEPNSVLIENSNFHENPDGGFNLHMRFKNIQRHPVATPWLEVTLTDVQDQVVLRRVFSIQDLGLQDHIAALRDQRVQLGFEVDASLRERIAGYRALIFYP
jgi:predicted Zn finger-like uncharacterized protein